MGFFSPNSGKIKIFFSGIAGSGMSSLALFFKAKGHEVLGSDRVFDEGKEDRLKEIFIANDIGLYPQDGSGIREDIDISVFSAAIEPDRAEPKRAESLGIKSMSRAELLRSVIEEFESIAVTGTSGKSTTSSMIAFLMDRLGLRPNFIGGGRVKQFRSEKNPGNFLAGDSRVLVAEACESDGTISTYRADYSVILNLSLDHHKIEKTYGLFKSFSQNSKVTFINLDDKNLKGIGGKIGFSIESDSDFRAKNIRLEPLGSEFSVQGRRFKLGLPGIYNIYNALSSISVLSFLGIRILDIADALRDFKGIERRFDIHLDDGVRLVIDDYAHNPHKIASLMESTKRLRPSICYIFQPHGFGPTRLMKDEYIRVFASSLRDEDTLFLLPILYKGGSVRKDISSTTLSEGIRAFGKNVEVVSRKDEILSRLSEHKCYVIMGARDDTLSEFAQEIARAIR